MKSFNMPTRTSFTAVDLLLMCAGIGLIMALAINNRESVIEKIERGRRQLPTISTNLPSQNAPRQEDEGKVFLSALERAD
jgi:hypothetical protein